MDWHENHPIWILSGYRMGQVTARFPKIVTNRGPVNQDLADEWPRWQPACSIIYLISDIIETIGKPEILNQPFRSSYVALVLLMVWSPSAGVTGDLERYERIEIHMGTRITLRFHAGSEADADRAAAAAFARVKELDDRLSDYRLDSELSRLSRTSGQGQAVPVSEDLWRMLSRSRDLSQRTDGAFDVTAGPAIRLWRHARRTGKMPSESRLARAIKAVGFEFMRLDSEHKTVELTQPNMRLDLGGIAKGYAADEALAVLRQHGIAAALVDAGGDLAIGEPPPGKQGWRIGIAPLDPNTPPKQFLILARCGVATSGDAFQHVVIDGTRYSHIIDPRTGLGTTTPCSVTVIGSDATTADGLASAICVLGAERGIQLADQTAGAAAIVVYRDGDDVRIVESREASSLMRVE
ncbi:MAG: FAD:protein FMN transferase [Pirellulales bacterium]|nr:FAD:protein FMN transferase [Pirellulales bacterium]